MASSQPQRFDNIIEQLKRLERDRAELIRTATRLDEGIRAVRRQLEEARSVPQFAATTTPPDFALIERGQSIVGQVKPSSRSLRAVVIDALMEIGCVASSRDLARFMQARFQRTVPPSRFGSLAADEQRAFQRSGPVRPVWLCHGLTHDRGEGVKGVWGLSVWPLDDRIIAPFTDRVLHLKLTARLCQLAADEDLKSESFIAVRDLVLLYARDLPGMRPDPDEFDPLGWRSLALRRLEEIEPADLRVRREAAERLCSSRTGEATLLFGRLEATSSLLPEARR